MTGLSTATQTVWRAHEQVLGDECVLTKTDMKALAAALRAAADQLRADPLDAIGGIHASQRQLLAIADELEGA